MKKLLVTMSMLGFAATAMADNTAMEYKTLSFEKGVTTLSDAQRKEINDMAKKFAVKGNDVDVTIATWSDEPIPAKGKSLSSQQREIAAKRSASIKNYMKELKLDIDDADAFNMAENPNFLAKTFNTESNKVKSAVRSEGDDSVMKNKYKIIKENGDAGKSVVIVRYDD